MAEIDTTYYCVERTAVIQNADLSWRGKATILRRDSGEVVDQVAIRYGQSPSDVAKQLDAAVQKKLAGLPRPPTDWGQDRAIPVLIQRYLAIRDQTYGLVLQAEKASSSAQGKTIRQKGETFEAMAMHTLQQDVAALSEAQKIALVTPTPQQRANRDDPEILDILSAKKVLYSLIDAPSPEVQLGYQSLKELLNAE